MWPKLVILFSTAKASKPCAITPMLSNKLANMALICSFLVVAIHTRGCDITGTTDWLIRKMFAGGISLIGVPFFFVAAGFFLAGHMNTTGWWRHECKKRIKTLIIPFFLWQILYFLWGLPMVLIANLRAGEVLTRNLPTNLPLLLNTFGLSPEMPAMKVLWFVRCLFIFICLSPCLFVIIKRGKAYTIPFLIMLYILNVLFGPYLIADGFFSLNGLFFFTLGITLRFFPIQLRLKTSYTFPLFVICLFAYFCTYGAQSELPLPSIPYHGFITMPLLLLIVWSWIPSVAWNKSLTSSAFPIYLLHIFILGHFNIAFKNIPALTFLTHWYGYFLMWGIATLGSILIAMMLRRYVPKTASILFGGR